MSIALRRPDPSTAAAPPLSRAADIGTSHIPALLGFVEMHMHEPSLGINRGMNAIKSRVCEAISYLINRHGTYCQPESTANSCVCFGRCGAGDVM